MAIAFRATSTGSSANATTSTISLPTGTTTGDVTVLFAQQATGGGGTGTVPTMTAPSGWTVLCASNGIIVAWRAYQAGDPASGITFTSSLTNWWLSLAVTYSGCDTSAPIDASAFCYNISGAGGTQNNLFRAPSILPNFNADVLLALYSYGGSTGRTIALPAGMTNRANTATGPDLRICEKTLVDGTPTGDIDTTCVADNLSHFGMQIALKTSGASAALQATARPTFGAIWNASQNASSFVLPLDHLNVQNGDLVILLTSGVGTTQAPSGWSQRSSAQGANVLYRTWSTGDPTSVTFSVTAGATSWVSADAICLRRAGPGVTNVAFDTSGQNAGAGTAATPSLAPNNAAELLLAYFGTHISGSGTWSGVTGGLADLDINAAGPCSRFSSVMPAANPSGAFSATFTPGSGSNSIDAFAGLLRAVPPVVSGAPMVSLIL